MLETKKGALNNFVPKQISLIMTLKRGTIGSLRRTNVKSTLFPNEPPS